MKRMTTIALTLALSLSILLPMAAPKLVAAGEPSVPLYTVEDFFVFPEVLSYHLAPDGESLIFVAPVEGVLNIFKRDIQSGEVTQLTFDEEQHVMQVFFKEGTLLFLQDEFGNENFSIFRMDEYGNKQNLTPYPGMAFPVNLLEDTEAHDEILIRMNRDDPAVFNIYRLNIATGDIELVFPATGGLLADNDGVVRVLVSVTGGQATILHRPNEDEGFERVREVGFRDTLDMLFFDAANEYVYALSNIGRETVALVRMDPATAEELEVVFEHEDYDVMSAIAGFGPGVAAGVTYHGDLLNIVFFEGTGDDRGALFAEALAYFPEDTIITGFQTVKKNRDIAIVTTSSDTNHGRQYLFDRARGTMSLLVDRNFTTPDHMAPTKPIRYEARDGLEIQGYLTLPVGMEPRDLPVVVNVHGGPWARDVWGFNPLVQFLANRGYAVFQPNFRGSTGFGRSFVDAGDMQWGLAMQDDISDGVLWLIEQGIADPERVAIFGGSYGGYAALAGVAFTPELYAAAISYVGVSSLFTLLDSLPPHWEAEREMFYARVGHPIHDEGLLRAASPLYHADRIRTPLFIAHGANDVRTTLIESVQMVQALDELGIDVEFMVRWDEGHGFANQQNRLQFYAVMEAFLAEHLGGRAGNTLGALDYTQSLDEVLKDMSALTKGE